MTPTTSHDATSASNVRQTRARETEGMTMVTVEVAVMAAAVTDAVVATVGAVVVDTEVVMMTAMMTTMDIAA